MRLIDADALKSDLIESKEKLWEIYNGLTHHIDKQICGGQIGSFVEAILRIKDAPTVDAVPVETVAQMFFDFTGDKCPCNFNNNDEWLPSVCEYEAEGKCPDPEDVLGCWKQYIKHYGERKDGEG